MSLLGLMKIVFAAVFLFFASGLAWSYLLFWGKRLERLERFVISIGISIMMLVLSMFIINSLTNWRISLASIMFLGAFLIILPLVIFVDACYLKRKKHFLITWEWKTLREYFEVKKIRVLITKELVLLLLILLLGSLLCFAPHFDYKYPIHTDEWHFWGDARHIISTGDISINRPEAGFTIFLSIVKISTDASYLGIFKFLPALVFLWLILGVYVLCKRYGFGIEGALLCSLLPTSIRYLGPRFLVPIAFCLPFIVITLLIFLHYKNTLSYVPLGLFLSFLMLVHAVAALVLLSVILVSAIVLLTCNMIAFWKDNDCTWKNWGELFQKEGVKHSYRVLLLLFLIFLAVMYSSLFWVDMLSFSDFLSGGRYIPGLEPEGLGGFLGLFGYLQTMLFGLGCAALLHLKREREARYLFVAAAVTFVFIILFETVFRNAFNVQILHDRTILILVLMMSMLAGLGLKATEKIDRKLLFATLAVLLIVGVTSNISGDRNGIKSYQYYITEQEYEDFIWIRDNLDDNYSMAVLDPWKAIAFEPITGKKAYVSVPQGPQHEFTQNEPKVRAFFAGGCKNTEFLAVNGISIVYTHGFVDNPELEMVRQDIYVLRQN